VCVCVCVGTRALENHRIFIYFIFISHRSSCRLSPFIVKQAGHDTNLECKGTNVNKWLGHALPCCKQPNINT